MKSTRKKRWSDYLWIAELCYLFLGLFNILFAWLGMLFFCIPLFVAIFGGSKAYCNRYCGRGQLFSLLGEKLKLSRNTPPPKLLRSPWFRYGFLTFFMVMFGLMLFSTYRVFTGAPLSQTVTLLWVFKLPWQWADVSFVAPWIGQFAFGFFGVMLTSTVLGLLTMVLFRPRSWCVYCPMGTMTQGICKLRNGKKAKEYGRTGKENSGAAEASGIMRDSLNITVMREFEKVRHGNTIVVYHCVMSEQDAAPGFDKGVGFTSWRVRFTLIIRIRLSHKGNGRIDNGIDIQNLRAVFGGDALKGRFMRGLGIEHIAVRLTFVVLADQRKI